ncbi:DUF1259 domain-containing protein [Pontibacter sp. 172403-2]|uniref:DUF1259 domain-containing protein n=1 Tax=Pontibacter rufus TaxID=2791028 RepID=UPI0018AFBABA|nr:DUF1259 domain-containing protein [Pontibacter sp. 172403-2]MBF9252156.1 DUF1259 domain-containing protein [Pontibacter sp. 172403-2]
MKKLNLFILLPAVLLSACNGNKAQDNNAGNNDSAHVEQAAEPATFSKIENLPAGIDTIFGKAPSKEEGFYKFSFPRTDLHVKLDGVSIDPRLAFTTWFAFMPEQNSEQAMLMGDMVLLEKELPAVEKKLQESGIAITAIYNHLLNENPKIMYLHVGGTGDPVALSKKLKEALSLTGTPLQLSFNDTAENTDWKDVEQLMGMQGKVNGPVLSFGIPRKETVAMGNMPIPKGFGIGTGLAFQKVGDKAAITGDFVLLADEVNPVIKALNNNGITVTALHNHMLDEDPRLFMMHFWAVGNPADLAKGLKAAVDKTDSKQ